MDKSNGIDQVESKKYWRTINSILVGEYYRIRISMI